MYALLYFFKKKGIRRQDGRKERRKRETVRRKEGKRKDNWQGRVKEGRRNYVLRK
jgi:hypothetical protein